MSNIDRYWLRRSILNNAKLEAIRQNDSDAIFIQNFICQHGCTTKAKIVALCSIINVENDKDVEDYRDACIEHGYEGCVIRVKQQNISLVLVHKL